MDATILLNVINALVMTNLDSASRFFGVDLGKLVEYTDPSGDIEFDYIAVSANINYCVTFDPNHGLLSYGSLKLTADNPDILIDDLRTIVLDCLKRVYNDPDAVEFGITLKNLCYLT